MAQPSFSKLLDWQVTTVALAGTSVNITLFSADDVNNRLYKIRTQWVARNSSDPSQGRTGEQVAVIAGDATTPLIIAQAAAFTSVGTGLGGAAVYSLSGTTVRFSFANDNSVTGEIMLSWRLEY